VADRNLLIKNFVNTSGWGAAERNSIAGDASNRRYDRLIHENCSVILMDAPPEKGEDVRPFIAIANHLRKLGFSAPEILEQDVENGFLILEDFGDDLFARVLGADPSLSSQLYSAATDALIELHHTPAPANLDSYDPTTMSDLASLAWRWYAWGLDQPVEPYLTDFQTEFTNCLEKTAADDSVLIQRDYHAENLLWLPGRTGIARVGMLDFQCATKGHPAYDLVSLMQDARRDVPPEIEEEMITRYLTATTMAPDDFRTAYHVLGAQRNLRILGIFARLTMQAGKSSYLELIPRVWDHLMTDIKHPALAGVADMIRTTLPEPTPENLNTLREKCATVPMR
jgi:aminoglycoside/choline kinase family phosphotransferase